MELAPKDNTHSAPSDQEHAPHAWRQLAEEREASLVAQEEINRRLNERNEQLERQVDSLRGELAVSREPPNPLGGPSDGISKAAGVRRDLAAARAMNDAMRATIAWQIAERLRRVFPVQSLRGRALRKLLRWMRRAFGPPRT